MQVTLGAMLLGAFIADPQLAVVDPREMDIASRMSLKRRLAGG